MKTALSFLLLVTLLPAAAQTGDPLKSPACGAALASLQAARDAGAAPAAVEERRSAAAGACLGSTAVPARPSRSTRAPVAVPPPPIEAPRRVAPLPAPVSPPPPVAVERPPVPAICDAGGCWSDGDTHLRHLPPNLAGPQGLCVQQGGLVYCP